MTRLLINRLLAEELQVSTSQYAIISFKQIRLLPQT